ncbi:hypothetical protein [Portibacter marinus]|uniref:hypothetical protein n=1 Tax=Portibacter marinus TaxID=2898660 RepID=UPI001F2379CB|nr:hypothetical protein [Portibacter marinus]
MNIQKSYLHYLGIFLLAQAILAIYLGQAFWRPSDFVFTFGGDGAMIYYNMIFHTFYGEGLMLSNMNYPRFDSLFMTDGQASFAIFFSWFREWMTPESVIGWSHRLHYLLFGLAGIFLYKTMELVKINEWLGFVSTLLILFLNPLMFRLQAGHFGLFYPLVFTYTFYYVTKLIVENKPSIADIVGLLIILVFFGLNNIYISIINVCFMMTLALALVFIKKEKKKAAHLLITGTIVMAIIYFFLHLTEIDSDRVEIQWGYNANSLNLRSIFIAPVSLLYKLLIGHIDIKYTGGETWMNIGIIPLLTLIIAPLALMKRSRKLHEAQNMRLLANVFLISSALLLLYSSAILYQIGFIREHIFHQMSIASMFKASGRFATPIYFMATLFAVYHLDRILKFKYGLPIVIIALFIWGNETNLYLSQNAFTEMHKNQFTSEKIDHFSEDIVNPAEFQAMYTLPVMVGWNDKFRIQSNFSSEYNSILVSLATGLPMINGMLSRIGVTDGERAIQMAAHPLIYKEIVEILPGDKPILLIYSKLHEDYTEGELYLRNKSELIHEQSDIELRKLNVDEINDRSLQDSILAVLDDHSDTIFSSEQTFFKTEKFDDISNYIHFSPPGALKIDAEQEILGFEIPDTIEGPHEISIYYRVSNRLFGTPAFKIRAVGQTTAEVVLHAISAKDNYIDWVRVSGILDIPKGSSEITVEVVGVNQEYIIDDFMLRKVNDRIIDGVHQFYNNFKVGKLPD